ncbi:MAG: hypothetical protein U1E65_04295 [Myxococcota bacterium]
MKPHLWLFFLLGAAPGAAEAATIPSATLKVSATVGSWQPLDIADVAKTIEQAALEVLTKPGLLQIERQAGKKEAVTLDYAIEIRGRILDEAESHTVYLSFSPGKKSDLPSFQASDTVSLQKLEKKAMVQKIEASAKKAASELLESLRPALERGQKPADAPFVDVLPDKRATPWQWPEVVLSDTNQKLGKHDLYSKNADERGAALRVAVSAALANPRQVGILEACALKHPDQETRLGCLKGLSRASRRSVAVQRVVISAFRHDKADQIRSEADAQMVFFTGAGREEAIQAWLESASSCQTPGPLAELGDLPNLDLAIKSCLLACGKREKYQRGKSTCIGLLGPLGYSRRKAVLWRSLDEVSPEAPLYLEGAGDAEGRIGTDWQRAVEAILDVSTRWDPALEEILWRRYQRFLSSFALDALAGYGAPSERLAGRLLEALQTSGGSYPLLWGLKRMAAKDPKIRAQVKDKIAEMKATGAYPKSIDKRALEDLLKDLERQNQKEVQE